LKARGRRACESEGYSKPELHDFTHIAKTAVHGGRPPKRALDELPERLAHEWARASAYVSKLHRKLAQICVAGHRVLL
jgi:hypothetical protein